MFRQFSLIISIVIISAIPSYASLCDDWNRLEKAIRDNGIERNQARGEIIRLDRELLGAYTDKSVQASYHLPVRGYGSKSIGGRQGNGYTPSGYDFYDGNRHGGHPAHDLFIRRKE